MLAGVPPISSRWPPLMCSACVVVTKASIPRALMHNNCLTSTDVLKPFVLLLIVLASCACGHFMVVLSFFNAIPLLVLMNLVSSVL